MDLKEELVQLRQEVAYLRQQRERLQYQLQNDIVVSGGGPCKESTRLEALDCLRDDKTSLQRVLHELEITKSERDALKVQLSKKELELRTVCEERDQLRRKHLVQNGSTGSLANLSVISSKLDLLKKSIEAIPFLTKKLLEEGSLDRDAMVETLTEAQHNDVIDSLNEAHSLSEISDEHMQRHNDDAMGLSSARSLPEDNGEFVVIGKNLSVPKSSFARLPNPYMTDPETLTKLLLDMVFGTEYLAYHNLSGHASQAGCKDPNRKPGKINELKLKDIIDFVRSIYPMFELKDAHAAVKQKTNAAWAAVKRQNRKLEQQLQPRKRYRCHSCDCTQDGIVDGSHEDDGNYPVDGLFVQTLSTVDEFPNNAEDGSS